LLECLPQVAIRGSSSVVDSAEVPRRVPPFPNLKRPISGSFPNLSLIFEALSRFRHAVPTVDDLEEDIKPNEIITKRIKSKGVILMVLSRRASVLLEYFY
jgi:hypothetical protein